MIPSIPPTPRFRFPRPPAVRFRAARSRVSGPATVAAALSFLFCGLSGAPAAQTPPAQAPPAVPPDLVSARTALAAYFDEQNRPIPDWERVAATLAFEPDTPSDRRRELASRLRSVINAQGLWVEMDQVPSDPEYIDDATRQHRFAPLPLRLSRFVLARGPDRAWRISADTVREVDSLYEETFTWYARGLLEILPPIFERSLLGFTLWQVVGLLFLAALAWAAQVLLRWSFAAVLQRIGDRRADLTAKTLEGMALPASWLATVWVFHYFFADLRLPVRLAQWVAVLVDLALAGILVWLAYRLIDAVCEKLAVLTKHTATQIDDHLIPLARTVLRVGAVLGAILMVAQNHGYSITTVVAGLGLGGLAVALAAQDTVANVIGSLAIVADRPFQVGDWILVGEHEGTVERVGLRSTRVRTFYDSLVSVPNSRIVNTVVDNMGQRTYRRMRQMLPLRYDTDPDRIHAFVEGIRAVIRANEAMRQDVYEIHLNRFSESSVDVMVYCFFRVPDWNRELVERHNFVLEVLRLARELGVEFAVPARTLQLESTPEKARPGPKPSDPADGAALRETVAAFGPGGALSRPKGPDPKTSD